MKYIIPFFILLSAFDAYATKCIGYYTSNNLSKRKLTAVCSHQTRIGNLDAHLI